jgi:hypothetical protein
MFVILLAYFLYFEKMKVGLRDLRGLCESPPPSIKFCMPEPIFTKFGTCTTAPEPISTVYFINPSHQSVSARVPFLALLGNGSAKCIPLTLLGNDKVNTFPRQQIPETTELLDTYVCRSMYPPIVAR